MRPQAEGAVAGGLDTNAVKEYNTLLYLLNNVWRYETQR
jgi:hypothetical protein